MFTLYIYIYIYSIYIIYIYILYIYYIYIYIYIQYIYNKYIFIDSNCCEMTDTALEFHFSVIYVLISAYVLD